MFAMKSWHILYSFNDRNVQILNIKDNSKNKAYTDWKLYCVTTNKELNEDSTTAKNEQKK